MTHSLTSSPTSSRSRTSGIPSVRRAFVVSSSVHRLRLVLGTNATTSALGGLVMAVAPHQLDELLGTGHPGWVRLVGLALVPFAAFVALLSAGGEDRLRRLVPVIVLGDVGWVVASVVTVLLGWYSSAGVAVVAAMAVAVDTFAVMQWTLHRRLSSGFVHDLDV